jgi:glycosyltransferase involved in cell wall biosynthesis
VLHVIRTNGLSGAERHLAQLVADLPDFGWTSDVLVATAADRNVTGLIDLLQQAQADVRTIRHPLDASPRLGLALARVLRGGRYDIIHSHLVHADWHVGLTALLGHRPALVSTKHNEDPFRTGRVFRTIEQVWLRRSDATIAISHSLADFVERWYGQRPTVVHYGLTALPPPPGLRRAPGRLRLLAVGRLERQKGFDVLIDAVARATAAGVDLELDICGAGSQRAALQTSLERSGIAGRVQLLGQRDDVRELMLHVDALVHPARWEGFGLVLLEAMRAGLPVIASAVGAIPEVVADGESGLLVAPDDAAALAATIVRVANDHDLLTRLGDGGRERLRTVFPPQLTARRTAEVYEDALRCRA